MKVIKYFMILLLVMVIGIANAGSSNDDTDKDSSTSLKGTTQQNNRYYAYINPKFTALTNRMNQMSASVRAFRNQDKITASSKLYLLRSQYTKPIITFANMLRPAVVKAIRDTHRNTLYQKSVLNRPTITKVNTIQGTIRNIFHQRPAAVLNRKAPTNINTIQGTLRNTLYQKPTAVLNRPAANNINMIRGTLRNIFYQKPAVVLNRPAANNIHTIRGTLRNTLYQKPAGVLNRPSTTNINTIQAADKLALSVNTISKAEISNVNTVGIKTKTLPNRIVYTNPITGGKTIFVRNLDENTYSQPEKAVNTVVQLTTPTPNRIVPLPVDYNTRSKISAYQMPYYQINTPPVPTVEPIVDNYIRPVTSQIRGDQNLARRNAQQLPTANPIPAPNLEYYDQLATTLNTQRPFQGTLMNNQIQPPSTIHNRQMTAGNPMTGSLITNSLGTSNTYPTRNQQTNQINSSSIQVYTNSVNPPQLTPTNQLPTNSDNALNFVRAFFQQLMEQHPSKNQYQIATPPTSKYNI